MPTIPTEFFLGGFESASHRRNDGVRLDMIRATAHDRWALRDYEHCARLGLSTLRDGVRWHLIAQRAGHYDWSSWIPMLEAAEQAGVRIIWTLHHYGAPDHADFGSPMYVDEFARFAAAAIRLHREVTGKPALVCPVNEISFFAWAVGVGYFPMPREITAAFAKRQLVRAGLAAVHAMRDVDHECRVVWSEPLIHVAPRNDAPDERQRAESYRLAQYEVYDLLTGRQEPEMGGTPDMVDVIGLNYYPHNQWYFDGPTVPLGHHAYRPLADMLMETSARYDRPVWIAETGAEGSARPAWLHYVGDEVQEAMARGVSVEGICLYPLTHYPGWDNGRPVSTGLFSEASDTGDRRLHAPLLRELERQRLQLAVLPV